MSGKRHTSLTLLAKSNVLFPGVMSNFVEKAVLLDLCLLCVQLDVRPLLSALTTE